MDKKTISSAEQSVVYFSHRNTEGSKLPRNYPAVLENTKARFGNNETGLYFNQLPSENTEDILIGENITST